MKKFIKLLGACSLTALLFAGCNTAANAGADSSQQSSKKVKTEKTTYLTNDFATRYEFKECDSTGTATQVTKYNYATSKITSVDFYTSGNVTKTVSYADDGSIAYYIVYEYTDNKKTKATNYSENGIEGEHYTYTYDTNGRLSKEEHFASSTATTCDTYTSYNYTKSGFAYKKSTYNSSNATKVVSGYEYVLDENENPTSYTSTTSSTTSAAKTIKYTDNKVSRIDTATVAFSDSKTTISYVKSSVLYKVEFNVAQKDFDILKFCDIFFNSFSTDYFDAYAKDYTYTVYSGSTASTSVASVRTAKYDSTGFKTAETLTDNKTTTASYKYTYSKKVETTYYE